MPEITRIFGFLAFKNVTFNFQKSVIQDHVVIVNIICQKEPKVNKQIR